MPPQERREQLLDAALSVIVRDGYEGVSIEAIARTAGVTRPVIYDHFPNLGRLLQALIEREERYALEQLAAVVPDSPGDGAPPELFATGVRRFLDAVASRPGDVADHPVAARGDAGDRARARRAQPGADA